MCLNTGDVDVRKSNRFQEKCMRRHSSRVVVEVFGGIHADGLQRPVLQARARLGADELSAPWCARSFRSIHAQRLSIGMHVAAAEEITVHALWCDGRADQRRLERRGDTGR